MAVEWTTNGDSSLTAEQDGSRFRIKPIPLRPGQPQTYRLFIDEPAADGYVGMEEGSHSLDYAKQRAEELLRAARLLWIEGEHGNLIAQRDGSTFTIEPAPREGRGAVFLLVEGVASDVSGTTGVLLPSADDAKSRAEEFAREAAAER